MEWLELKIPPVLVGLVTALCVWLAGDIPMLSWPVTPSLELLAAVMATAGLVVAASGVVSFYRARTSINPHAPHRSTSLITTGMYAWTRNPMYMGMFFVLLGWALVQGGLVAVLLVFLFIPYMNRFQIVPEERVLRTLFGEQFEIYQRRVRRWM